MRVMWVVYSAQVLVLVAIVATLARMVAGVVVERTFYIMTVLMTRDVDMLLGELGCVGWLRWCEMNEKMGETFFVT